MWIDVYDFDGTLFRGDSTMVFWLYCLRKKPSLMRHLPRQAAALVMMATKRWSLTRGKGEFLRFMRDIDVPEMAERFWSDPATKRRLVDWFEPKSSELPVVIASASPEIMLAPIARELGVPNLIGTRVEPSTGKLIGNNCKSAEKIERLRALFPDCQIRAMYTDDTKADGPLLQLAQQKYHVRKGQAKRIY